jgi:hypothetical protein
MLRLTAILALLASLFAACDRDVREYTDQGSACVAPKDLAAFQAGGELTITVTVDECISSCTRIEEASCEATLEGERIVVRSEARWAAESGACIALCAALQAQCSVTLPSEGAYTLEHGGQERLVELPSAVEEPACTPSA